MRWLKLSPFLLFSLTAAFFFQSFLKSNPDGITSVHYTFTANPKHPNKSKVSLKIADVKTSALTLRMPRWAPGSYRMREFAYNVSDIKAWDDGGNLLELQKYGADGWSFETNGASVQVEYDVEYAFQPWSARFDSSYMLVEGPATFVYVDNYRKVPVGVTYQIPDDWQVISPLPDGPAEGEFVARNYDILVDAPAQLGKFEVKTFELGNAQVQLVFSEEANFSRNVFTEMVRQICAYQAGLFNEIPFDKYIFFYRILPGFRSGGGLEHWNSTTIGLSAERLNLDVITAAEVTAHEFFHVWNVKRVRPAVLWDIDYGSEARTSALWFLEGVTSYYEALTVLRTGLWTERAFLDEMAFQITRLQQTSERGLISVETASREIWERGYGYPGVSFYNKGEILGMLLDLKIRQITQNHQSLDDVMRKMNEKYGKRQRGFREEDIESNVTEIAGEDFSPFFDAYVSGTTELPYSEFFDYAGISIDLATTEVPAIGAVVFGGPRNRVFSVEQGSALDQVGLERNDYLLSLAGTKITSTRSWRATVNKCRIGENVDLRIWRNGGELILPVKVGKRLKVDCALQPTHDSSELQLAIRNGWFSGHTGSFQSEHLIEPKGGPSLPNKRKIDVR